MNTDDYTISEKMLDVGDGHKLYVQDWGNKKAKQPIIFLHGGPGGQVKDKHKMSFDPKQHRVIFFDQRGGGKSTPTGSLKNNNTDKLIGDITKIADYFKIKKFVLTGGSWGSTLALAYAIQNPKRVLALVITGIFTGTNKEIEWIDRGHFKTFFPEVWQDYLKRTPKQYQDDPSIYHMDKVINGTKEEQKLSGYAYGCLEYGALQLNDRSAPEPLETFDPSGIRIEMYYLYNKCFLPEGYILNNTDKLTMPVHIVQGRYDMVCPPQTAHELHTRLANSKIYWTISGHSPEHEVITVFQGIFSQFN